MSFFGKKSKRKQVLEQQEENFRRFKKELEEEPFEKGDYLAMVIAAFWALWPVLAIVIGIILLVSLPFLRA